MAVTVLTEVFTSIIAKSIEANNFEATASKTVFGLLEKASLSSDDYATISESQDFRPIVCSWAMQILGTHKGLVNEYPKISVSDADYLLRLYSEGNLEGRVSAEKTIGEFPSKSMLQEVQETLMRLFEIAEQVGLADGSTNTKARQQFHSLASVELHQSFSNFQSVAKDPNFWRWVNFYEDALGAALVDLRYGGEAPGSAPSQYYGIGLNNQGILSSLWLRAELMYDAELNDPYELSKAILDLDFWWSHFIRLRYACCRPLARAFVRFVVDNEIPHGNISVLGNDGFRDLQPELRDALPQLYLK